MKRLIAIIFTCFFSIAFAAEINLRDYDEYDIPEGTHIPVISLQEFSTAYCEEGDSVSFVTTSDIYLYNKNIIKLIDEKYSNDGLNNQEGFTYKNVYATHIIGPLLIRNPYLTDYLLSKVCKSKKLKYKSLDITAKEAYKKYLENFN